MWGWKNGPAVEVRNAWPRMSAVGMIGILAFIALISILDYSSGYETDVFVFYFLPVAVAAWSGSSYHGYATAILAAVAWHTVDRLSGHPYAAASSIWWNTGIRLLSFLIIGHDVARIRAHLDREREASRETLRELHTLCGLLPICASCKKIRDDQGYWRQLETFIEQHSDARFTHGLCKSCADRMLREYEESLHLPPDSVKSPSRPAEGREAPDNRPRPS